MSAVWHMRYPRMRLSEWGSWKAVVDWSVPLYRPGGSDRALQALADEWRKGSADDAGRIIQALRFVQDKVRYTGIEIGPGAYQPTDPARVLERRYGDCKDKAMLLVTMLAGDEHRCATGAGQHLARRGNRKGLPGPRCSIMPSCVSATAAALTGSMQPRVCRAGRSRQQTRLALARRSSSRRASRPRTHARCGAREPTTEVSGAFNLAALALRSRNDAGESIIAAADADWMRRSCRSRPRSSSVAATSTIYRDWYPGIKAAGPLQNQGRSQANRMEVVERYTIEPAFVEKDDGSRRFDLNPYVVTALAKAPKLMERSTPSPSAIRETCVTRRPSCCRRSGRSRTTA